MTDETPEFSPIEEQAEQIIRDASAKLDLDGDNCPMGEACAVHYRNDEEVINEEIQFGRLITYTGEYVVVTSDNPDLENPVFILKMVLGQVDKGQIPPLYETCVIHVGDGSLADLRAKDEDARLASIRFIQKHNEWDNFKDAHAVVVNGVKEELIDVSKPVISKEK